MSDEKVYDRFDLEQAIMTCWNTADDLDILAESVLEDGLDEDAVSNALLGLQQLHHLRMSRLWNIFEYLIETGQCDSPVDEDDYED
jgi:hypothetical protein